MKDRLVGLFSRVRLRVSADVGEGVIVNGRLWVHGGGRLTVGDGVRFEGDGVGIELQVEPGAELCIGRDVVIGQGTSIEATERITIGDGCRIGAFCKLLDNHMHVLKGGQRDRRPSSVPVELEPGVVLEDFAIVLAGAHVGLGAHVGRGATVVRHVPPGAVVRGRAVHPAREADRCEVGHGHGA